MMKTEEKAKVLFGGELIQFLTAIAILIRTISNNRMSSKFSFKSSWCKLSSVKQLAQQGIE